MPAPAKITRDGLADCVARGLTRKQAAEHLGVSGGSVSQALAKFGMDLPLDRARGAEGRCRACADEGLNMSETARRIGVSVTTVSQTAKRYGIRFSASGQGLTKSAQLGERLVASLTKEERKDFNLVSSRLRYGVAAALAAIGRRDLAVQLDPDLAPVRIRAVPCAKELGVASSTPTTSGALPRRLGPGADCSPPGLTSGAGVDPRARFSGDLRAAKAGQPVAHKEPGGHPGQAGPHSSLLAAGRGASRVQPAGGR